MPFETPTSGGLKLESVHVVCHGIEPEFTNYTEGFKGCLDYITYVAHGLRCAATGELPPEINLKTNVALPNSEHPSDHLPVLCRMEFT